MREFAVAVPNRMLSLPVDRRGYPVPKFVQWIEGEPDFRVMSPNHLHRCIRHGSCWICGEKVTAHKAFVIGPMCCVNRVSSEPPCHYECAAFAAMACPFLTLPKATRREANMPTNTQAPAGVMLKHNPGVAAVWVTKDYRVQMFKQGPIFHLEEPSRVEFYAHARRATFAEVEDAVRRGLPSLERSAMQEGRDAINALQKQIGTFRNHLSGWMKEAA